MRLVSGAQDREEVCEKIRKFWENDWKEEPEMAHSRAQRMEEFLLAPIREMMQGWELPEWTEADLEEGMYVAFKKARGSGSADGWRGDEVQAFPKAVQQRFYHVTRRWRKARAVPTMEKVIRQSSLQREQTTNI